MISARSGCAAVSLDEHRIMVAGGKSGPGQSLQTTEILDVRTMAFAPGPSMTSVRWGFAAVPVDDRHVLFIGGQGSSGAFTSTELLDVSAMDFEPGPAMGTLWDNCAAVRLDVAGAPRILAIGGRQGTYVDRAERTEVLAVYE